MIERDEREFVRFVAAHPEIVPIDGFAFDLNGVARGKRYRCAAAEAVFRSGTQMANADFLLDATGTVTDAGGHGMSDGDPDGLALHAETRRRELRKLRRDIPPVDCRRYL